MDIKILRNKFINDFDDSILKKELSTTTRLIILSFIVLFCLILRLSTIQSPAIDRTDWKEIDHITISMNYYKHGFNFFKPEISWPAEPPYVTAMELPLVPYITSFLYPIFGINVYTVRFLTLFMALMLVIFLYKLTRQELGDIIALCSAFVVSILPLNNPYGKFLFSEPTLIFFSVFSLYYLSKWLEFNKQKDFILSIVGFTLSLSLKPTSMYLIIPYLWLYYRKYKIKLPEYKSFLKFFLISLIIPIAWYSYAYYLVKTSIDVFGVFGGHDKFQTLTMLSSADWYRMMFKRISVDILGHRLNLIFIMIGIIFVILTKRGTLFLYYLLAIISFFIILAEGNYDTGYRQLTIIPAFSVLFSLGTLAIIFFLIKGIKFSFRNLFNKKRNSINSSIFSNELFLIFIIFPMLLFYNNNGIFINNSKKPFWGDCWELAQAIKKNDLSKSKIIAAGAYTINKGGNDLSPVIYYYADVTGWTLSDKEWNLEYVKKLIKKGASAFVAYHMYREPESITFIDLMKKKYKTLFEDKKKSILLLSLKETQ